jgi:hypothetical protein
MLKPILGKNYIKSFITHVRSGVQIFKFSEVKSLSGKKFLKDPLFKKGKLTLAVSQKKHDFIPEQVTKMFVAEVQFCNWYFENIYNMYNVSVYDIKL